MAHYNITCSCGHTDRVELYGKGADRERKMAWLETEPCTKCREAERSERRAKEAAEFQTQLKGSEKQVAWALDIRSNAMQSIKAACKPEVLPEVTKTVESISSAAWWIDNRDDIIRAVLKVAVANRKEQHA
jgi:hypothetical protein